MKRKGFSPGFTLLEMLAALAMAGAVMAPLYIITRGIAEQTSSKQKEVEAMQRARIAMDTLIRDFSRAGLFTSPNTFVDSLYLNNKTEGSSAQYRAAVVHLNVGEDGPDGVLLSGNFLGSNVYRALATSENILVVTNGMSDEADCTEQFDSRFAFAHISDPTGRQLDARVTDTAFTSTATGGVCTVTIASADTNPQSFKPGDTVQLSANQTIVYAVENETLVRYFVAYDSDMITNCQRVSAVTSAADIRVPGTVLVDTRQVTANFVTDFQVWFRPVTNDANDGWVIPHYQTIDAVLEANESYFKDGFTPSSADAVIPANLSVGTAVPNVTCGASGSTQANGGPELVRSALIRLTVRSETSDPSLKPPGDDASRLEKHLLAADTSLVDAEGNPLFAYVLRTMTTEVEMPNLTARSDLLAQ